MSRKKESLTLKALDHLTPNEAHLLLVALEKKAQTIYWDKDANEVHSLIAKGLLESVLDESTLSHKPFRIPKFVWDHLQQTEVFQSLKMIR
jgi:hypothetical protein